MLTVDIFMMNDVRCMNGIVDEGYHKNKANRLRKESKVEFFREAPTRESVL